MRRPVSRAAAAGSPAVHLAFSAANTAQFAVTMDPGAFGILIAAEWVLGLLVQPRLRDSRAWTAPPPRAP